MTGECETLDPATADTHLTQITIFTMETVFLFQKLTGDYEDPWIMWMEERTGDTHLTQIF